MNDALIELLGFEKPTAFWRPNAMAKDRLVSEASA